jgi:hypothetical protein
MSMTTPRRLRVGDADAICAADEEDVERSIAAVPLTCGRRMRAIHAWLSTPIHASTLGVFRVVFSICMYKQGLIFADMFDEFRHSKQVFPYPALGWVEPVGYDAGVSLLALNRVACFLTCIGLWTKAATMLLFVTFTYLFVLCESNHNNHYILICHVTFFASLIDWGKYCSVDHVLAVVAHRRRSQRVLLNPPPTPLVPYWHLLLMQFIFSVPYFFGSIAKCNEDWLGRAQPLIMRAPPSPARPHRRRGHARAPRRLAAAHQTSRLAWRLAGGLAPTTRTTRTTRPSGSRGASRGAASPSTRASCRCS